MNITVRDISIGDSPKILAWRNHPTARKFSLNSLPILQSEHDSWFAKRLKLINTQPFWIFTENGKDIGYVRLEDSKEYLNSLEISININPIFQKKGFGSQILNYSLSLAFKKFPFKKIIARVDSTNVSSISLFQKENFYEISEGKNIKVFEKVNQLIKFVFRSDASKVIGSGHILRSIGIIEELVSQKYKVVFIGDVCELSWVMEKIKSVGFMEIFTSEQEFLSNKESDILILDSYDIKINSPFISLDKWKSVIVLFDAYTPNYNANLKIYPGITRSQNLNKNSKTISGPKFIPIRKSISKIPEHVMGKELNITVVGGGVDFNDFVPEMSLQLSKIPGNFRANFFTNNSNKIVSDNRFKIFPIGSELDPIGNETHLAFSTASTTCLEFIARGCALGICCTAENQESYYQELSDLGLAKQIGRFTNGNWILDVNQIENLVSSEETRKLLTKYVIDLIDLNGSKRIVNEIFEL